MIKATVRIDPARRIGALDPNVYGQFIEHLGRCIYGGIFEPGSPLADAAGFRTDVMEAARRLRVPVLRWPGGNFVSGYHWQDGIGPASERPGRRDTAWRKFESNRFGTDEFIDYCRAVGAEPYVCFNMGTGTMDEAQAWLEYCNGRGETPWSRRRIDAGRTEPYGVKYWGLGNEVYGPWQIGYKSAVSYAEQAREYAKFVHWTDRDVRLIACGGGEPEWDWEVLKTAGHFIDYISYHDYFRPDPEGDPYESLVARGHLGGSYIRDLWGLIEAARHRYRVRRPIHICVDEWNVFYRRNDFAKYGTLHEEQYDLADALCVAAYLNTLIRNAHAVTMANMAQMVNVIAPIFTSPEGLFLQTIYYPLLMHAEHRGSIALDAPCESDTFDVGGQAVPYVDVAVTYDEASGDAYIHAVNLHRTQAASLTVAGTIGRHSDASVWEISGGSPDITNSFAEPENVVMLERQQAISGAIELPPLSASTIRLELPG
ncbi:MAG: alpha-N-arabinofuranosidase [Chloroflexi bacterium]|nr:alpha-N-arabinofuranosidase [Chloroflexota bacterium]